MIRAILLLLLAFFCLEHLFYVLFAIQIFRYLYLGYDLSEYLFGLAKAIDYMFGFLVFGVFGHTMSALVYKHDLKWAVKSIDWIFQEQGHCREQYEIEYE